MGDEWLLKIEGLEKRYGKQSALRLNELTLIASDRVIVSGTNGSGKSTLLRIVAGITRVSTGVRRAEIWAKTPIGYLPQEGGIYKDLTVRENHQTFCRLMGSRGTSRAETIADTLGISSLIEQRVGNLSGGHQRLAALFCLMASGARILILDEPFSALNSHKETAVRDSLKIVDPDLALLMISAHLDPGETIDNTAWNRSVQLEVQLEGSPQK